MREYKLELTDEEFDLLKRSVCNTEEDSLKSAIDSAELDLNDTAMRELKRAATAKLLYTKLCKANWKAMENEC